MRFRLSVSALVAGTGLALLIVACGGDDGQAGVGGTPTATVAASPEGGPDDTDGIAAASDNCPLYYNPGQDDTDADGTGDVCEEDPDGDGVPFEMDNCLPVANSGQEDSDGDGVGDACGPPVDPCALVTREDVQEFLKEEAPPPSEGSVFPESCSYEYSGVCEPVCGLVVDVRVKRNVDRYEFQRGRADAAQFFDGEAQDVASLGDAAYAVLNPGETEPGSLYVHKGQIALVITAPSTRNRESWPDFDWPGFEAATELARRALGRLE